MATVKAIARGRAPSRVVYLALALALPAASAVPAARITAPSERELALTIYGQGVAVVHDRREVSLPAESATIIWPGVAPSIQRDTVRVGGVDRALQSYRVRHEPVSMQALLSAYVGQSVGLERTTARGREQTDARLVSADPPLVSVGGEVHSVDPAALVFPEGLPSPLGRSPGLELQLLPTSGSSGVAPGESHVMVGYLADGISWTVDYVATLGAAGDRVDLAARATIANASGMDIVEAGTELVAGRIKVPQPPPGSAPRVQRMAAADAEMARPVAPERLGDLQRYALPRPVTVADGEHRSVRLFARRGIPVERTYVLGPGPRPFQPAPGGTGWRSVALETRIAWIAEDGPLPAGAVRVYREGEEGRDRFVGGDRIEDRPRGHAVRIEPGRPFDVTARRRQTHYERLDDRVHAVRHEIRLHNSGPSVATIRVEERIPGDWRITEASRDWQRAAAHLAVWRLEVPPGEAREIAYRARIER